MTLSEDESGERTTMLARYRDGYRAVETALHGATDADLDRRPADGEWTAREIVHHLADMEAHGYIRLRTLLADDAPTIHPHDEPAYARRLHYERPIGPSLDVFRAVRESSAQLLEALTPEEWTRHGVHPVLGSYDMRRWLRVYAEHPHNHAAQIRTALRLL